MTAPVQGDIIAMPPAAPKRLPLWFNGNGGSDPTAFSGLLTSVTRLTDDATSTPFYRLLLEGPEDIDSSNSIVGVACGFISSSASDSFVIKVVTGLGPAGDARQAGLEIDVVVSQVSQAALLTALDTAINAGEAAVSAGDGGAAALAAVEGSLDTYAATVGALTGATNSLGTGVRVFVELLLDIGTPQ